MVFNVKQVFRMHYWKKNVFGSSRAWTRKWKTTRHDQKRRSGSQSTTSGVSRIPCSPRHATSATCPGRSWSCRARRPRPTASNRGPSGSSYSAMARVNHPAGPVTPWRNSDSSQTSRRPNHSSERYNICFTGLYSCVASKSLTALIPPLISCDNLLYLLR